MIRALIFDFDGTILDTETPTFAGWQQTYAQHGQSLSLQEYSLVVGTDYQIFNPRLALEERTGRKLDWPEIDRQRQAYYHGLIEKGPVLPGISNLLAEAAAAGLPCAVASSSPVEWVRGHLERRGLLKYFSVLSCAGNGRKPKPAPDVYLHALESLQASAHETVAIEDSLNGFNAARAAGIPCVVVPNEITRHLVFPPGQRLLSSLGGIGLATLREHCNT